MNLDQVKSWLNAFRLELVLAIIGLILLGAGLFWFKSQGVGETNVEVISASDDLKTTNSIFIDISGSVNKAGVYELASESRVNDAIMAAGGLSTEADLEWVSANLNRAQTLVDGAKIYIPSKIDTNSSLMKTSSEKISINSATKTDLELLSGIGPVTAEKIISNRPYQTIDELLNKKVVGEKVFESIKDQLSLW